MRTSIAFLFIFSLCVSTGRAQIQQPSNQQGNPPHPQSTSAWTKVDVGFNMTPNDLYFLNRDTGWVTGTNGIVETTDGGQHWQQVGSFGSCWRPQFTDALNGWVLSSQLEHTTNGGTSWTVVNTFGQHGLIDFQFLNPDTGFACNSFQAGRTVDAGLTWISAGVYSQSISSMNSPGYPYDYVVGSRLPDSNIAPLHGTNDTAYSDINLTTDGGVTWKRLDTRLQKDLYAIKALDSLHVVIGGNNIIAVTWDGGKTWNASFPQWGVDGFYFFDSLHGWLSGSSSGNFGADGLLAKTSDGGNTWTQVSFDSVNISTNGSIVFTDSLNGWLIASQGLFHTTTGGVEGVQIQHIASRTLQVSNYPDPFSSKTNITYSLPQMQHVTVQVFDLSGKPVSTLLQNAIQTIGIHSVSFDGTKLAAGVYSYQITTEQYSATGKLNLVK